MNLLTYQTLTSVKLVLITVILMPHAITLLGVSLVSAMKDSVEMEELVLVRENVMFALKV